MLGELLFLLTDDARSSGWFIPDGSQSLEVVTSWDESDRFEIERYFVKELGFTDGEVSYREDPDYYHELSIVKGIEILLNNCDFVVDRWYSTLELTRDVINVISDEVELIESIRF